jgi:ElaB/YqjD/DUF883 family membrane-anchored ribosome-binding protein
MSIADLEREADRRKQQFKTRIDQVRRRLTPQNIADDALRALALPGRNAADALVDTARRNPLFLAGVAAGVGLLILNARQTAFRSSKHARHNNNRLREIGYGNTNKRNDRRDRRSDQTEVSVT